MSADNLNLNETKSNKSEELKEPSLHGQAENSSVDHQPTGDQKELDDIALNVEDQSNQKEETKSLSLASAVGVPGNDNEIEANEQILEELSTTENQSEQSDEKIEEIGEIAKTKDEEASEQNDPQETLSSISSKSNEFAIVRQNVNDEIDEGNLFLKEDEIEESLASSQVKSEPREKRVSYTFSLVERDSLSDDQFSLTSEKPYVLDDYEEPSILAESVGTSIEETPSIDRQMYCDLYVAAQRKYTEVKLTNNFLQKKLVDYYTKRRMYNVLKEAQFQVGDVKSKYEQKLDHYDELVDKNDRERSYQRYKINDLKLKCQLKSEELEERFEKLQLQELGIAKEIYVNAPPSRNLDKVLDRLLRRQKYQLSNLIKLRMDYIRIRNRVNDVNEALKELDHLGPGYRIMDYEQLKIDNRNLKDKLEEKEVELTSLRRQCRNNMQILAHRREKSTDLTLSLTNLKEELTEVLAQFEDARKHLIFMKTEKQEVWRQTLIAKQEAGLLTKPKLLRDMAKSIEQVTSLSDEVVAYQEEYKEKTKQVKIIRKRIEMAHEMKHLYESPSNENWNRDSFLSRSSRNSQQGRERQWLRDRSDSRLNIKPKSRHSALNSKQKIHPLRTSSHTHSSHSRGKL